MTAVLLAGLLAAALAGVVAYGRWAGWGFGLRWWGRPTPAQVQSVEPLRGALLKGGAPWAMREARHRVRATVEVRPVGATPYRATTTTWRAATEPLAGEPVTVRVSRTRPSRVHLPLGADRAAPPTDPTAGVY